MPDSFQQAVDAAQSSDMRVILQRLDTIEKKLDKIGDDHEVRLRKLETEAIPQLRSAVVDLTARMSFLQIAQAGWSAVLAAIAAYVGRM